MTKKTLRINVPAEAGHPSAYLRLGSYVSGEDPFPSSFTGDKASADGILMTTAGTCSVVAGSDGYVEVDESVAINVTSGAFSTEAAGALSVTAKSLYLESGSLLEENSAVPSVTAGQAKLSTTNQFHAESSTANVTLSCPAEGLKKNIATGFEEIWGNQEKSNGSSNSIILGSLVDIPIGVYPSFSSWRMKIRGQETKNAVSASTMALAKTGAVVTKLDNKSLGTTAALIATGGIFGHVKKAVASFEASMAELGNISIEITDEEIHQDLFGVGNWANVADIRSF